MAKDNLAPNVSKPEGGFYESSEEVRAEDAEKAAAKEAAEEVVEEEVVEKKPKKKAKKKEKVPEPALPPVEEAPASARVQRIRDSQK